MQLTDTHCHIQSIGNRSTGYDPIRDKWLTAAIDDAQEVIAEAVSAGVTRMLCVGTTLPDSQQAVEFVQSQENCWTTIGLHPHEGAAYVNDHRALEQFRELANQPKVMAIGETGLDYYYQHSPPEDQKQLLRFQLDLAVKHKLPLVFHVREAFDDFWPIFDEYKGVQGVVHSFSSNQRDLEQILSRGLYVGLNGIMTFTKVSEQLEAAKQIPLDRLLLETDAPFLTPVPFRGKICQPKYVAVTARFLAELRGDSLEQLAKTTTANAQKLFNLP